MVNFPIVSKAEAVILVVEETAWEGVKRVAARVAKDIALVTDRTPEVSERLCENGTQVLCATVGKSDILSKWEKEGLLDLSPVRGKREVYGLFFVEKYHALAIVGSDKRGTIYGMFSLSEKCGVSPLVYWGDVMPEKKKEPVLSLELPYVSKEPSVKYRGFFINDEWPAFGNWCTEKFGGVNAKAYEEVFLLLLRLKGNYLWPAMWNSVFSEEGPGPENAKLADIYGIVMGLSHHEPMCRAGAEWQRIYQKYGDDNTWSFVTNSKAITEFWKDGILRNKPYENLITIGMRGEEDSKLLPENATMKENIQVIKDAILTQHRLIRENINENLAEVPRMLAIYKEVEDYYYGDETCVGLKEWEELDDVILMLCEDNFGNTRGLPMPGDRPHKGGYGMYYHFDYHGAPVSYEWQNCSRLDKIWEQMTVVYEHGVRELWIVNVGDLKGMEYPLQYFMELAYDYEKWSRPNTVDEYMKNWVAAQFPEITEEQSEKLIRILNGWTRWAAARRPEAMNENVYHPCNFGEGERVHKEVEGLLKLTEEVRNSFTGFEKTAFESMIYYPAVITFNLILFNIEAGMNSFCAMRGSLAANGYGAEAKRRILRDAELVAEYHRFNNGKWNHMMDSPHTGFRSWDDRGWAYPVIKEVLPVSQAKMMVGFRTDYRYHLGKHWQDGEPVTNYEMTRPDTDEVLMDLDCRGNVDFSYRVSCDREWLDITPLTGRVEAKQGGRSTLRARCLRELLKGRDKANIEIAVNFDNGESTVGVLAVVAGNEEEELSYPKGFFLEKNGYVAMEAAHFAQSVKTDRGEFLTIRRLGRMGDAIKAFPVTVTFEDEEAPYVRYDFVAETTGEYTAEFSLSPRNPRERGGHIRFLVRMNDGEKQRIETVPPDYFTEWRCNAWNRGVMDNIRTVTCRLPVAKGENSLFFYAKDPGIVLERIVLHPAAQELPQTYLGPLESFRL